MAVDPDVARVEALLSEARAENERMRGALRMLRSWDMLSLRPDGHGAATADAPWARALIDAALDEPRPSASSTSGNED